MYHRIARYLLQALVVCSVLFAACEDDDKSSGFELMFINTDSPAGRYIVPWGTDFPGGQPIPSGYYNIVMRSGSFREIQRIFISPGLPDVIAGCDSAYQAGGSIPNAYDLVLGTTSVSPGDTICIEYALPAPGRITITIVGD